MKQRTLRPERNTPDLPALALIRTAPVIRFFARILALSSLLAFIALVFLPWRQFIGGNGRVIAYDPLDRRINVEAQLPGRVKALYITEGVKVKKGQKIAELQDNDPHLLENLQIQLAALKNRREISQDRVRSISAQIDQQELGKHQAVDSAQQRVLSTRAELDAAQMQYTRTEALSKQGLLSKREFELATMRRDTSQAAVRSAEAALQGTANAFDATIASTRAQMGSAQAEIATADREIAAMEVQINRVKSQVIEAPRDGIVLKIEVTDGTYLRPGSPICVIIPDSESRFVELWIDGNDAPLVKVRTEKDGQVSSGSPVRIAFAGWPSVQLIGWPSLAINTFGGEVVLMDPTDDGSGKFRIVVAEKPDEIERNGERMKIGWPERETWLRQGVRANGWVMLNEVPLWFELWRQANGFPPKPTKPIEIKSSKY